MMAELKGTESEVLEGGREKLADIALSGTAEASVAATSRTKILRRLRFGDTAFRRRTRAAAILVLIILSGVIIALIKGSLPALQAFGLDFLIEERWNPVTEKFGALAPIYGTLVTSFIAMRIAVPLGLLIALFLTELSPMWLRRPIGIAIELLAGIPSIIHGIWRLCELSPLLQRTLHPALKNSFANVPLLVPPFARPAYGRGPFTPPLIPATMVVPL